MLFCLKERDEIEMKKILESVQEAKDSVGGVVECIAFHLPQGLGDPIYEKIEGKLAAAMMSIPASKAFEIGDSSMDINMHFHVYFNSNYCTIIFTRRLTSETI